MKPAPYHGEVKFEWLLKKLVLRSPSDDEFPIWISLNQWEFEALREMLGFELEARKSKSDSTGGKRRAPRRKSA